MGYLTPPINDAWKQTLTETAYTPDVSVQLELKNGEAIVFDLDRVAKGFVKGLYGELAKQVAVESVATMA